MKDQQSISLLNTLHPKVRQNFQDFIEQIENDFNLTLRIASAYRSMAAQEKIYAQGRTTPGPIVSQAPPGSSYHNWGMACDILPLTSSGQLDYNYDQGRWANIAQQYSIDWGGNWTGKFKDLDHWECKMGHNWRDLLDLYHQNKFIPGSTQYLDI